MKDVFIVDGVRTPIGKFRGGLSEVRADDLAALTIKALLKKNIDLDPSLIDDVILGCHNQAGEDNRNVARMALLLAGLPATVPGETVNRLCASGMSAVIQAYRAVRSGDGDIFLAGGVEHMTRSPYVISKSSVPFGSDAKLFDSSFGWRFINPAMKQMYGTDAMGETAEAHVLGGSFGLDHSSTHTVLQAFVLEYQWDALSTEVKADFCSALKHEYPPQALLNLARAMGVPTSLGAIGFRQEDIEKAVAIVLAKPYANPKELTTPGLINMLTHAYHGNLDR